IMVAGIVPAIFGLIVTYFISRGLASKGPSVKDQDFSTKSEESLPSFFAAIIGPIVTIILLALRPLFDITIDPLIALPVGGIVGAIAMGAARKINDYAISGLGRMSGV